MRDERPWLATDLDNTLIHSRKKRQAGDICVEWLEGTEQSFLSETALHLLRELRRKLRFLAVTTRSREQYLRIRWPEGCRPEYAIVSNGAGLFCGDAEVPHWQKAMAEDCLPYREELERLRQRFGKEPLFRCRLVDDAYLFLCAEDGRSLEASVEAFQKGTTLTAAATGRKLYFFPPPLDKGGALERLRKQLSMPFVYGAGDSPIDLPLLLSADAAFVPHGYPENGQAPHVRRQPANDENFAEWFLKSIATHINNKGTAF